MQTDEKTDEGDPYPTSGIKWTDLFSIFEFKTSHDRIYRDMAVSEWCRRQNITEDNLMSEKKLKDLPLPKAESSNKALVSLPPCGGSQDIPRLQPARPPKRPAASHADPIITKKRRTQSPAPQIEPNTPLFETPAKYETKMASYAAEMLSSTNGTRSHFFQCLIEGDIARFHYSDPTGIVWSTQFSWIRNLEKFAAILLAIAYCDHERLGMTVPGLTPPEPKTSIPKSLSIPPVSLKGYYLDMDYNGTTARVTLSEPIYIQYSLVGRDTCIYEALTSVPISGCPELVIKISMQFHTREPEVELLLKARAAGVGDHLPEPHMWSTRGQQWCSSKGVWGVLYPNNAMTEYKSRIQDIIVLTRHKPLEKALTPQNMYSLFNQLFGVLHHLRYDALMLHCDISPNNLMCEVLTEADGTEVFMLILIDIDLAISFDKDGNPTGEKSKHHTGTLPFMAIDLLENTECTRCLRHDFESVFYVALWFLIKSKDTFTRWESLERNQVHDAKCVLWGSGKRGLRQSIYGEFQLADSFSAYEPWILRMWEVFDDGNKAYIANYIANYKKTNFDMETLGGQVTHANMKAALESIRHELEAAIPGLL
ncbi:hypothetical protein QCA50_020739 [Cerrena zonata]|uniref:Fungal-type protein kinase domain-containing protein n=1 Tax=Cerrena zonata TaxID=2478898 RepID=A0AAW0FI42_9APHY